MKEMKHSEYKELLRKSFLEGAGGDTEQINKDFEECFAFMEGRKLTEDQWQGYLKLKKDLE